MRGEKRKGYYGLLISFPIMTSCFAERNIKMALAP